MMVVREAVLLIMTGATVGGVLYGSSMSHSIRWLWWEVGTWSCCSASALRPSAC